MISGPPRRWIAPSTPPPPAKRLFDLEVTTAAGTRPDLMAHLVRALSRPIEALLVVPYVAAISLSHRHQRFGDMASGCLVMRRAPKT